MLRTIQKLYWTTRARLQFLVRGVQWPKAFTVLGPLGVSSSGRIEIGRHVTIVNDSRFNRAGINRPSQLVASHNAVLKIGDHVGISGGTLYATERIELGNHVLIGANSQVFDTDFHPLHWQDRRDKKPAESAAVIIEDDVWLGAGVTVLKGVRIGARSVIAAGSVVTSSVPSDVVAGGVPAKVLREIEG